MDDLLGEDWQSSSSQSTSKPSNSTPFTTNSTILRPLQEPISKSTTPTNLVRPSTTVSGQKSNLKSSNDAFQGLSGLKSLKPANSGVSIQERQQQLAEERARHLKEQGSLLDSLGSRSRDHSQAQHSDVDDILAAFNKDAKVDRSSHFPPPSLPPSDPTSRQGTPAGVSAKQQLSGRGTLNGQAVQQTSNGFDDDDDTFGLSGLSSKRSNGHATAPRTKATVDNNDDDLLGELGRPVQASVPTRARTDSPADSSDEHWDENVAQTRSVGGPDANDPSLPELLEMGFPVDTAKIALAENGGDVNRAVGWLLQQAHAQSKREVQEQRSGQDGRPGRSPTRKPNDRAQSNGRQQDAPEKDAAQIAQEFGSRFLKSAGSLWKAGQKQMAKTVADFQQERDPAQPKWMQNGTSRQSDQPTARDSRVTTEAALLDMPREERPRAPRMAQTPREESPFSARPVIRPRAPEKRAAAAKLSAQEIEEQSAQAYVSPARRRPAKPKSEPPPEPEVDLFSPAPTQPTTRQTTALQSSSTSTASASPIPAKAKASPRTIPAVSSTAIASAIRQRTTGTEAFKRGDYGAAHDAYTAATQVLPATHPLLIVLLSNRSLTALKTGDPKVAISDADRALELIGPGLGIDETIDVDSSEPAKDMREFYGKALMRKAEALEHMEKWNDAASVWRLAVEAGVGGAISIRGRDRCEKAANPAPPELKVAAVRQAKKPPVSKAPAAVRPVQVSDAAVKKLREANAAAERADDEKFQLTDVVDARIASWKGGKADNLRALLQSLDAVLWESAGWKTVGMSDLVMPTKVKIIYMKAIAKVHPDKIAQDATTEQRMISSAVFSTLNEAWDKFKKDNNM